MAKENILSKKYPHLIKEWCFEKNGDLTPDNVTYGSHKKVWWKCLKHEDHVWLTSVQYRQYNGCPFCVGLAVTKSNCLATTHPNELKEWNFEKNINLTPENITSGSNKKVWWKCLKHEDHIWQASPHNKILNKTSCPCCQNRKIIKSNCVATTHPNLIKEWHKTNKNTPYNTSYGSDAKILWQCENNKKHKWITKVLHRTLNNSGCPYCLFKTEEKIRKTFGKLTKNKFIKCRPTWLKNPKTNRLLELDGFCKKLNLAFEYNGKHHYEKTVFNGDGKKLKKIQNRDFIKNKICKENNIKLITISFKEIDHKTDNAKIENIILEKLNE